MKKLMLIGATIVAGLIAYVSLYSYVDVSAGLGKEWTFQGNAGINSMEGIYAENYRVTDASGEVTSISFSCIYKPNSMCWEITGGGGVFRYYGIGEQQSDPNSAAPGSGTVETVNVP